MRHAWPLRLTAGQSGELAAVIPFNRKKWLIGRENVRSVDGTSDTCSPATPSTIRRISSIATAFCSLHFYLLIENETSRCVYRGRRTSAQRYRDSARTLP